MFCWVWRFQDLTLKRLGSMMNELPFEVFPLRLTCAAFFTDRAEPTIGRTFLEECVSNGENYYTNRNYSLSSYGLYEYRIPSVFTPDFPLILF